MSLLGTNAKLPLASGEAGGEEDGDDSFFAAMQTAAVGHRCSIPGGGAGAVARLQADTSSDVDVSGEDFFAASSTENRRALLNVQPTVTPADASDDSFSRFSSSVWRSHASLGSCSVETMKSSAEQMRGTNLIAEGPTGCATKDESHSVSRAPNRPPTAAGGTEILPTQESACVTSNVSCGVPVANAGRGEVSGSVAAIAVDAPKTLSASDDSDDFGDFAGAQVPPLPPAAAAGFAATPGKPDAHYGELPVAGAAVVKPAKKTVRFSTEPPIIVPGRELPGAHTRKPGLPRCGPLLSVSGELEEVSSEDDVDEEDVTPLYKRRLRGDFDFEDDDDDDDDDDDESEASSGDEVDHRPPYPGLVSTSHVPLGPGGRGHQMPPPLRTEDLSASSVMSGPAKSHESSRGNDAFTWVSAAQLAAPTPSGDGVAPAGGNSATDQHAADPHQSGTVTIDEDDWDTPFTVAAPASSMPMPTLVLPHIPTAVDELAVANMSTPRDTADALIADHSDTSKSVLRRILQAGGLRILAEAPEVRHAADQPDDRAQNAPGDAADESSSPSASFNPLQFVFSSLRYQPLSGQSVSPQFLPEELFSSPHVINTSHHSPLSPSENLVEILDGINSPLEQNSSCLPWSNYARLSQAPWPSASAVEAAPPCAGHQRWSLVSLENSTRSLIPAADSDATMPRQSAFTLPIPSDTDENRDGPCPLAGQAAVRRSCGISASPISPKPSLQQAHGESATPKARSQPPVISSDRYNGSEAAAESLAFSSTSLFTTSLFGRRLSTKMGDFSMTNRSERCSSRSCIDVPGAPAGNPEMSRSVRAASVSGIYTLGTISSLSNTLAGGEMSLSSVFQPTSSQSARKSSQMPAAAISTCDLTPVMLQNLKERRQQHLKENLASVLAGAGASGSSTTTAEESSRSFPSLPNSSTNPPSATEWNSTLSKSQSQSVMPTQGQESSNSSALYKPGEWKVRPLWSNGARMGKVLTISDMPTCT